MKERPILFSAPMVRALANAAEEVIHSMAPFADDGLTTSALRVLACTAEYELGRALRRGDYRAAQEAAYAALQACAHLEKRTPKTNG